MREGREGPTSRTACDLEDLRAHAVGATCSPPVNGGQLVTVPFSAQRFVRERGTLYA